MAGRKRRRGHAAASARILTAGLSSAAAFGMVAGMAISSTDGQQAPLEALLDSTMTAAPSPTSSPATDVVVVVRRHWVQAPFAPGTPATAAPAVAPVLVAGSTARPVSPRATTDATAAPASQPAAPVTPRPVTRTRAS